MMHWSGLRRRWRSRPANLAARVVRHRPVAALIDRRHAAARHAHAPRLPALAGDAAAVVAGLRQSGVCTIPIEALALAGADRLLADARRIGRDHADHFAAARARGEDYLIAPPAAIHGAPELYRFGLDERLLDIVEAYVGLPVGYDGVVLQHSPADGRAAATRAWHRDREDRIVVKVAVYLDEVGPDDGPFELLADAGAADGDAAAPTIACTGPAGTMVFADTARFLHRGRPITGRPRTALFFSYFAERPRDPWYCARTGTPRGALGPLLTGLSPRQRRAALWRRRLPLVARLVPPAPL